MDDQSVPQIPLPGLVYAVAGSTGDLELGVICGAAPSDGAPGTIWTMGVVCTAAGEELVSHPDQGAYWGSRVENESPMTIWREARAAPSFTCSTEIHTGVDTATSDLRSYASTVVNARTTCDATLVDDDVIYSCPNGESASNLDGSSCSVATVADDVVITCEDGTSATLPAPEDGSSCSVEQSADGAVITCDDGSSASFSDGQDGADGMDGAPGQDGADGQDGAAGQDGVNGEDGTSCTVVENDDGSATITCPDASSATVGEGSSGCSQAARADSALLLLAFAALLRRRRATRLL